MGERYQREGRIEFVGDMSMTFHIVSYLKGQVPDLDKVGNTLLEPKDQEHPIGWLEDGRYLTHHNMDVVVLFQYAWPHMNEVHRRTASIEIEKMLQWCLKGSVLPDGSFRASTGGEDSWKKTSTLASPSSAGQDISMLRGVSGPINRSRERRTSGAG